MSDEEMEELKALWRDQSASADEMWEWCLDRGGYEEVIANLLARIP